MHLDKNTEKLNSDGDSDGDSDGEEDLVYVSRSASK